MRVPVHVVVSLTLSSLLGCVGDGVKNDYVKISGVVVDEALGSPLTNVYVELHIFEQKSLFRMGSYKFHERVETSSEGAFLFTVESGKNLQITSHSESTRVHGGHLTLDKVKEDVTGVVLRHSLVAE